MKSQIGVAFALPYVFTEQGVAMLSSVLRSQRAVEVNIAITCLPRRSVGEGGSFPIYSIVARYKSGALNVSPWLRSPVS